MNIDKLRRALHTRDEKITEGWSHNDAVAYARNAHGMTRSQMASRRTDMAKRQHHDRQRALTEQHYRRHPELAARVDVDHRASADWWRNAECWHYHANEDTVTRPTENAVFERLRRQTGGQQGTHGAVRHRHADHLDDLRDDAKRRRESMPLRMIHALQVGAARVSMAWHSGRERYVIVDEQGNVVEIE